MKNEYFVRVFVRKHDGLEIPLFSKGMESKEQAENVKRMLEWVLLGDIDIIKKENKEVLHAKWFKKIKGKANWMACSNCGREMLYDIMGNNFISTYCPHCGAKMYGVDNGEEND